MPLILKELAVKTDTALYIQDLSAKDGIRKLVCENYRRAVQK
jgi:hypothetical protein